MYKCRHFTLQELVSRQTYERFGQQAWRFLDQAALVGIDTLRDIYGPCTINNWHRGGEFEYSGHRADGEYPASSPWSAHRHGKAFDLKFAKTTAPKAQADIRDGVIVVPGLTELEVGTATWTHVAFNTNVNPILVFRP